jgi:hypothetical protein
MTNITQSHPAFAFVIALAFVFAVASVFDFVFACVGASLQGARSNSQKLAANLFAVRKLAPNPTLVLESQLRLERIKWQ